MNWIAITKDLPPSVLAWQCNNALELPKIKTQKTRKRKKGLPKYINAHLRIAIFKKFNYTCCHCGSNPIENKDIELQVDHIVARSNGGSNNIDNLQLLCRPCNYKKGNKI